MNCGERLKLAVFARRPAVKQFKIGGENAIPSRSAANIATGKHAFTNALRLVQIDASTSHTIDNDRTSRPEA